MDADYPPALIPTYNPWFRFRGRPRGIESLLFPPSFAGAAFVDDRAPSPSL